MTNFKLKFKDIILRAVRNQLVKGSAVLFVGSLAGSFGNFLYHLLMGRMLGPVDYGALESIISLTYYAGIPLAAFNLAALRKVSVLQAHKRKKETGKFYAYLAQKLFWLCLVSGFILTGLLPVIKNYLHLDSIWPVVVILVYSLLAVFNGLNTTFLSGFYKFTQVSLVGIVLSGIKVITAVVLVSWGLAVFGASVGFLLGIVVACLSGFSLVKKMLKLQRGQLFKATSYRFRPQQIVRKLTPFVVLTVAFASLYTTDIIFARHFLPAKEAGYYAALSVIGKIIFFACFPIGQVMFPIITAKHTTGKEYRKSFYLALGMVFLICLGVGIGFYLFPVRLVKTLFGSQYLVITDYLPPFVLFLSFYSLADLVARFYFSISRTKIVIFPALAALGQAGMIIFFHRTITQIAWISAGICGLLFASLMVYFFINNDQN